MPLIQIPPRILKILAFTGAAILLLLFGVVLIKTAWLSDDAYISYRAVDNIVNGYGPTFNPGERVQAFTHPLWMFLHVPLYAITDEIFFTGIYFAIDVTLIAVLLLMVVLSEDIFSAVMAVLLLIFSKAFIDYSTSGLENPLTHVIIALFAWIWLRKPEGQKKIFWLAFFAGLALLNRMDTILLFFPALVWICWMNRSWRTVRTVLLGMLPFILWEIFSVFYYGFPFPNTAYAKLGAGIPAGTLLGQGFWYYVDSIQRDPITLITILGSLVLTFMWGEKKAKWLGIGLILYLLYILRIGGDFMSGRFFTAPLFLAVILLIRFAPDLRDRGRQIAIVIVFIGGMLSPGNQLNSPIDYGISIDPVINEHGIADERAYYYMTCGLLRAWDGYPMPNHYWAQRGKKLNDGKRHVHTDNNMGFVGFFAGPKTYLIDQLALVSPVLARLPRDKSVPFRPGHYARKLPEGYVETRKTGQNVITDPDIAILYDKMHHITQGELWDMSRLKEIVKINLGWYDLPKEGE